MGRLDMSNIQEQLQVNTCEPLAVNSLYSNLKTISLPLLEKSQKQDFHDPRLYMLLKQCFSYINDENNPP